MNNRLSQDPQAGGGHRAVEWTPSYVRGILLSCAVAACSHSSISAAGPEPPAISSNQSHEAMAECTTHLTASE